MSREFVDNVEADNNISATDDFKTSMIKKIGDALEIKRTEVSKTFVAQRKEMEKTDEEDV